MTDRHAKDSPTQFRRNELNRLKGDDDFLQYLALYPTPWGQQEKSNTLAWMNERLRYDEAHFLWTFVQGYLEHNNRVNQTTPKVFVVVGTSSKKKERHDRPNPRHQNHLALPGA